MSVKAQIAAPVQNEHCYVCWEDFDDKQTIVGHKLPGSTDDKIYCLVHETCLKESIQHSSAVQCPHCKRSVEALSLYSWRDLPKASKSQLATTIALEGLCLSAASGVGAYLVGKKIRMGEVLDDRDLYKVMGWGFLICSLPLLNTYDPKPKTRKMVFTCFGAISGFTGASMALHLPPIKAIVLAVLSVGPLFSLSALATARSTIHRGIAELDQRSPK